MTKGIALINVLIISSLLSLLAIGFAFIMVSENKIGQAQELAGQTHYLAEAGVQYSLWQLNNNWKDDFETGALTKEIKLNDELYSGDEIKITATSIGPGNARVESNAVYKGAERKIIVEILKAVGEPEETETQAILTHKKIFTMMSDEVNIVSGSVHANTDIELKNGSMVNVENTASAQNEIIESASTLNAAEKIPYAEAILMPMLDFDKYKGEALVLSEEDFENCLEAGECILNGINYVVGESCIINIKTGQKLTINGFLLIDCSMHINILADLLINNTPSQPSGLASKGSIIINPSASVNIAGLIYSLNDIIITATDDFSIQGGIVANEFDVYNQLINPLTLTYNEAIIKQALGQPEDSPLITINHWEEEY